MPTFLRQIGGCRTAIGLATATLVVIGVGVWVERPAWPWLGVSVVAAAAAGVLADRRIRLRKEQPPHSAEWLAREQVERLRLLESAVVHARDAVVILEAAPHHGPGRSALYVNDAFCQMTGYSREEVIGRSLYYLRGPKTDPATLDRIRHALDTGTPLLVENLNYRKDGSELWIELSLVPVLDPSGRCAHFVMIQRDIGDRKKAEAELKQREEQLRHAQKMEAVGQMAGGIAHDFNNLLTAVIGNMALVRLPETDPNRALVATAERAAHRAAELTRKLLGFARKNQLLVAPVRVDELVRETVDLLRRTLDPRIEIVTDLRVREAVTADSTLLNQALLNLCLNARDAMPDGGKLSLTAEPVTVLPDEPGRAREARPGHYIRVTVADTGHGIPADVLPRIFDPFFTTKPVGQGTGLGLPMVHGIVEQHHGWIECTSAVGQGTRFVIYLPRNEATLGRASTTISRSAVTRSVPVETPPPLDRDGPTGTVLLVDDEDMIRELGRSVLQSAGFRVIEAADGADAVEAFREHHNDIDMVVLDLTMPRLSGRDAFRAIYEIDPAARVLLSSGFSADDLTDLNGVVGLLSKPYRPADLLTAVRAALAAESPAG